MKKKGFCRFYKKLYWGESVKKRPIVKWKLNFGSGQFSIYCILRPFAEGDQLDIVHCAFLRQPYYRENPAYVYGIAGSKKEALELVVKMTNDALSAGYEGRILEYLDFKGGFE